MQSLIRSISAGVTGGRGTAGAGPRRDLLSLPALGAGSRGPSPTCCGRGCAGVGARYSPFGFHALRGAACRGGGGRPSRGGGDLSPL